jgi:hypothetical protein
MKDTARDFALHLNFALHLTLPDGHASESLNYRALPILAQESTRP